MDDTENIICDGRCGMYKTHRRWTCPLKSYWEITDNCDGTCQPWIFKLCSNCTRFQMHTLENDRKTFLCMKCLFRHSNSDFIHLRGINSKQLCRLIRLSREHDYIQKSKIVNRLGDKYLKDTVHPRTEKVHSYGKLYNFSNKYYICALMVDHIYLIPGNMEKQLEEKEKQLMYEEDYAGNLKYDLSPLFSPLIATLHLSFYSNGYEDMIAKLGDAPWIRIEKPYENHVYTFPSSFQDPIIDAKPPLTKKPRSFL